MIFKEPDFDVPKFEKGVKNKKARESWIYFVVKDIQV